MTTKIFLTAIILFVANSQSSAQHIAMSFKEDKGKVLVPHLDSVYHSAVHSDTSKAVFKTEGDQKAMFEAYVKLLQDFGKFLTKNDFLWEAPTKGFNRIYFNSNGTIDYFVYSFSNPLSPEKETEFNRLLNSFIKDYRISLSAKTKFAQCSPTTYNPKK